MIYYQFFMAISRRRKKPLQVSYSLLQFIEVQKLSYTAAKSILLRRYSLETTVIDVTAELKWLQKAVMMMKKDWRTQRTDGRRLQHDSTPATVPQ